MPALSHELASIIGASAARASVFMLIKADGAWVRAWSGVGDFDVEADGVESEGGTYRGIGEVIGLPVISQLINGKASRVDFVLSGVSTEILALADADAEAVRGAAVHLGIVPLDADWQALSPPFWLWEGAADCPRLACTPVAGEGGQVTEVRSMSLSVGSAFTGRRRPRYSFYTDADQQARSPGDKFCNRVAVYGGAEKKWP